MRLRRHWVTEVLSNIMKTKGGIEGWKRTLLFDVKGGIAHGWMMKKDRCEIGGGWLLPIAIQQELCSLG